MKYVFVFLLSLAAYVFADTPLGEPEPIRSCDSNVNYCAFSHPDIGTSVYSVTGEFEISKIYDIPGWHRYAFVSPSGEYFVSGYHGANLVPLDVTEDQVMVTFWKNGKNQSEITLGQILTNMESLQRTASHYQWGTIEAVYDKSIHVETVEGNVFINLESGEITKRQEK